MRAARLRRTADIARVRSEGVSLSDRLFAIHVLPTTGNDVRLAVSASRALGKAVTRNRARRRIREAIRVALKDREAACGADVVVVARPPVGDAPAAALRAAVDRQLQAVLG